MLHSLYNLHGNGVEHPKQNFVVRGCWEAGGTSLDRRDDADCIIVLLALNHDLDGTVEFKGQWSLNRAFDVYLLQKALIISSFSGGK